MDEELRLALEKVNAKRQDDQDFDLAHQMLSDLANRWPEESEIYWNMALCDYRVVYTVEANGAAPEISCYDVIDQPFSQNGHFQRAMELGDVDSIMRYREAAGQIENFQKELKDHSENTYDVFISFKKTDADGNMTEDYMIAKRLENELHEKYRVFMSEFSLSEDNIADNYNTSIYNAILSAKYFILLTTREEYLSTIWIENEWKRGNYLTKKDPKRHKMIVVCREEVLGKFPAPIAKREALGFRDVEDAVHKIKIYFEGNSRYDHMENQLNIIRDYLSHGRYDEAAYKCDEVINIDNTYSAGHWYKMLSLLRCDEETLPNMAVDFRQGRQNVAYMFSYEMAMKYATAEQREKYQKIAECCMINLTNQYNYDGTMRDWLPRLNAQVAEKVDPYAKKSEKIIRILKMKDYLIPTAIALVLSIAAFYFFDTIMGWLTVKPHESTTPAFLWAAVVGTAFNVLMMSAWVHINTSKAGMFFAFLPLSIIATMVAEMLYVNQSNALMFRILSIVPMALGGIFLALDIFIIVWRNVNKKKFARISDELNQMLQEFALQSCAELDTINREFEAKKPTPNAKLRMAGATDIENVIKEVAASKGFAKR